MGKCFLGTGFGAFMAISFFVCKLAEGSNVGYCLAGALEWVLLGGMLTLCALGGYALYDAAERRRRLRL